MVVNRCRQHINRLIRQIFLTRLIIDSFLLCYNNSNNNNNLQKLSNIISNPRTIHNNEYTTRHTDEFTHRVLFALMRYS